MGLKRHNQRFTARRFAAHLSSTLDIPNTMKDETLILSDGRKLGYEDYGVEKGTPFILFHGTPGSRKWFTRDEPMFEKYRLRILTPERPGYGNSDIDSKRTIASWARDVVEFMDQLGIEKAHFAGVSGGGAYVISCAALMPSRIISASLISSVAPPGVDGYVSSMAGGNKLIFFLVDRLPFVARQLFKLTANAYNKYPKEIMKRMRTQLCESDIRVLNEGVAKDIENAFTIHGQEAFKNGTEGIMSDMSLVTKDWGIDFSTIRVPILLWHGESDTLSPIQGGRYLAKLLPKAKATFIPGAGHFLLEDDSMCEKIIEAALAQV